MTQHGEGIVYEGARKMPSAPDTERRNAISASYARTRNLAETAREFGISRERVRQIAAQIGDHPAGDRREKYNAHLQRAIAELAVREGVTPVARLACIGVPNLRCWIGRWFGVSLRSPGKITATKAALRDIRIRAALAQIMAEA